MLDTEHAPDTGGATRRLATPREEDRGNARRRVQIAAVEKLHPTVDDRTLCGLVTVDALDGFQDDAGLGAWNDGPLDQCAQSAAALLAPIRPPASADLRQQTAEPDTASTTSRRNPIPGQRA